MTRKTWVIVGVVATAAIVGFLLWRRFRSSSLSVVEKERLKNTPSGAMTPADVSVNGSQTGLSSGTFKAVTSATNAFKSFIGKKALS